MRAICFLQSTRSPKIRVLGSSSLELRKLVWDLPRNQVFLLNKYRFSHQQEYINPETGNFCVESVLVISIADSDFVQAFCQKVNKLLITNCP